MIALTITPDIDRSPWVDLDLAASLNAAHSTVPPVAGAPVQMARIERVGLLRHGTQEGRATVTVLVRLPDGSFVLAETTLRNAAMAARVIAASPAYAEEAIS
ncbi:MAG: hypothetical protein JWM93_2448 [Frankiales bacterium]|nr:hypothetical protein [Frankiales bacterium]